MLLLLVVVLAALLALLAVRLYRQAYERPPNFPPGPPRLPIWGSYWLLLLENYGFMHKATLSMARRYKTRLLGLYLGQFPTVVATSYEDVRAIMTRPEFASRPDIVHVRARAFGERLGIFFSDGQSWLEQKRFMLRNMRDYGFGRRYKSMEETLREEVEELVALGRGEWKDEKVMKDDYMLFPNALYSGIVNLLWMMMAGNRFSRDQYDELRAIAIASEKFVQNVDPLGGAVAQTPWLLHIAPESTGFPSVIRNSKILSDAIKKALGEHESTYSDDHQRDYIDRYIFEMRKLGRRKEFSFTEEQLQIVGADLLLAAPVTTTSVLTFAVRSLFHHPEIQTRCQKELDEVVGRDRLPTLDDRPDLPYTEAVIRETMRFNTLLPFALPHLAAEDTTLGGYDIPKNTIVLPNVYAAHHDKEMWGDPENFRPDRFLDEEGKMKKDMSLPFGAGKRLCPGETFSRQGMFVTFAALLQNFQMEPKDRSTLPPNDHIISGLSVTPGNMWVRLTPRF